MLTDAGLAGPSTPAGGSTTSLPADLLSQTAKRVQLAAWVVASACLFVLVMNTVVMRVYPDQRGGLEAWPMPGYLLVGGGLVISIAMAVFAGRCETRPQLLLNLVLAFEVLIGAMTAAQTQWQPMVVPMRISWLCVLVILIPAIVPHHPRTVFFAALATVSMDPLFFWLLRLRTPGPPFHAVELIWMFVPNYVCALLAPVPAGVIRGLGAQVKKARELGNYRIGNVLASGGMGQVFRAEHQLLARPAAIKLIHPNLLGEGKTRAVAIERFKREAEAAALLQSPHTIALYDFGVTSDGTFYYAMELLDGPSFEQLVERFGPVSPARAIALIRQACESLAEAHARGLVHRDIKPSNLVASRLGLQVDFVKVLDFGLVKFDPHSTQYQATLTAPEIATGTPAFMAPEAALGEKTADHRVDIYSLGCVLYWLLTGRLVFESESPLRMMQQHIMDPPLPPSKRTELTVPPALDDVVMRCLAKKADDRPSSALELSRMLNDIRHEPRWNAEQARVWWDKHLPHDGHRHSEACTHGVVVPVQSNA